MLEYANISTYTPLFIALGVILLVLGIAFLICWYFSSTILYPKNHNGIRIYEGIKPSDLGLSYENVNFITSDKMPISAWYIHYKKAAPSIVLVHGHGNTRIRLLHYAPFLYHLGFNLLFLDLRNCGESVGKSTFTSMGYYEKEDILAAVNFLIEDKKSGPIGVYGYSMGSVASIMAMAKSPKIKAAIFDSSFEKFSAIVDYNLEVSYKYLPKYPLYNLLYWIFKKRTGISLNAINPVDYIHKIAPRPILIVHSTGDLTVPFSHALELCRYAGDTHEFWKIEDVDHMPCWESQPIETEKRFAAFFKKHLSKKK